MTDTFGRGMSYRLQGVQFPARLAEGEAANAFNLSFWRENSHLKFFGVELRVTQGSVAVRLWHEKADGTRHELALLDCPFPGSQFSPPLELSQLAKAGGRLIPELLHARSDPGPDNAGQEARFDLYFGTNDLPRTPSARLAFLVPPHTTLDLASPLQAWVKDLYLRHAPLHVRDHCAFLQYEPSLGRVRAASQNTASPDTGEGLHAPVIGLQIPTKPQDWWRQNCHALTYGALSTLEFTHLAVLPEGADSRLSSDLLEELVIRNLARALFQHETVIMPLSAQPPVLLVDLQHFYRRGLPQVPAAQYSTAPPKARLRSVAYWRGLFRNWRWRRHWPEAQRDIAQTRLAASLQQRRLARAVQKDQRQLKQRLAPVLDAGRVEADLERANRLTLNVLRDRHKGARAVIIGNGPSLKIPDLDRLHNEVTFASNKIFLAYDSTPWRPTYYSVEDHLVLRNNWQEIEALQGSIKLFPANMRDFGFHAPDTIFAPFLPPQSFDDPLSDPEFPAFSTDLTHGIAWGSTIVYSQIQMAFFMGCTEIVLIGLDHSYQLPDTKQGNRYVYAGEKNHFHPDYRSPGEVWHQPNLDVLEVSYAKARSVCDARGVRIVNASRATELAVFERADFDQLFPA